MQALNTIPRERAEWFIWLDMDMVLENVTFDLPLDSYEGRDIIMWGQPEWIAKGHNAKGSQGLLSLVYLKTRVSRCCTASEDASRRCKGVYRRPVTQFKVWTLMPRTGKAQKLWRRRAPARFRDHA